MTYLSFFIITICFYLSFTANLYAYLDPGTGSMLLSSFFGIISVLYFVFRSTYYKIKVFILSLFNVKAKQKSRYEIVFYSEGPQYWNTFKPIIDELVRRGVSCAYLSSNQKDEGLQYPSDLVEKQFIGKGATFAMTLNILEADVFALTTPGLDVLQIKKSKGVKHFCHILHACTDVATYKLFSFDFFDSIFVTGDHHVKHLRELENVRNAPKKELYQVGLVYMDELVKKQAALQQRKATNESKGKTIVVAPTWGQNGLLTRFGTKILLPLLTARYNVIVRPHPQRYLVEQDLLNTLKQELSSYSNLTWDSSPDNFETLASSDIMISDLSGVVFDFAFVFEKPVITIKQEIKAAGMEIYFLSEEPWELTVLNEIGQQITLNEVDRIAEIVSEVYSNPKYIEQIIKLRDTTLRNYGRAGKVAAETLIQILEKVKEQ